MTILNLMLGKGRGGLEQASLDYAEALALAKIPSLSIIAPQAWIEAPMAAAGVAHETLIHYGPWDILASWRLRAIAKRTNATAVICHGNRAVTLALRAFGKTGTKVIGVAHNYSIRRFSRAYGCFSITQHLADHLSASGAKNITVIPNMVRIHDMVERAPFRNPPVIGSMGRFVAKKGFKTFIEALSILRSRGIAFNAVLGGDGEEAEAIDTLIKRYQLDDQIERIGWVQNKNMFFHSLDIFVLPSLHEAFGIVLIEAMDQQLPVISTDTYGPVEILSHEATGVLVPQNNPEAMADALADLLANPAGAATLGQGGRAHVREHYSMQAMAQRLQVALAPYI